MLPQEYQFSWLRIYELCCLKNTSSAGYGSMSCVASRIPVQLVTDLRVVLPLKNTSSAVYGTVSFVASRAIFFSAVYEC